MGFQMAWVCHAVCRGSASAAFGKAVVFVDIVCIPWIVNPPVVYGDAAEIGNAFGDFTCFGFDFFVQYGDADGAEVFFEQLCQAKSEGASNDRVK